MRNRRSSERVLAALLCALPAVALAQQTATPADAEGAWDPPGVDLLTEALACRASGDRLHSLLPLLRQQRPDDFAQVYRQYAAPAMDLYRLHSPVIAWGQRSDSVVIAGDRVMIAVDGTPGEVGAALEQALESSVDSPLTRALDEQHALVLFEAGLPGLEGTVLLGCEYRIEGLSLLDDPAEAWRRRATEAPAAETNADAANR
jgi:hypothetical protein